MDVLGNSLETLRVRGQIVLCEPYARPFAIAVPDRAGLSRLLDCDRHTRPVAFHYVRKGAIEIGRAQADPLPVVQGSAAISFGGDAHQIGAGTAGRVTALRDQIAQSSIGQTPGSPADVELVCGVFLLSHARANPLVEALPSMLVTPSEGITTHALLDHYARLMADAAQSTQVGSNFMLARLIELFCGAAICWHVAQDDTSPGLPRALSDLRLAPALQAIHANPGQAHTVESLAAHCDLSPSRFAARFKTRTGVAPMRYLTRWRMNVAGRLLSEGQRSVGEVALACGYRSDPAFSRTFKQVMGQPPAHWRQAHQAG